MDWSKNEVRLIVNDYFKMLVLELNHHQYSKTDHRYYLSPNLNNRSKGSIEFKHQNITAALMKMGLPYIKGYKARFKYQHLLDEEIASYLDENQRTLEKIFDNFSRELVAPEHFKQMDFQNIVSTEPIISKVDKAEPLFRPIKINYLEKEQNNRSLGEQGEQLILEYEKWRLIVGGKAGLADKIEWISKDAGDGAGFDILSKETNGTDRYIEVKTTKLSKETPIYLSKTELSFSAYREKHFFLYRLFNFDSTPRFFIRKGRYETFCDLIPESFKGFFN